MTTKETGRDRGDGATRKSLLQQIHTDFPGNSTEAQQAGYIAAERAALLGLAVGAGLLLGGLS